MPEDRLSLPTVVRIAEPGRFVNDFHRMSDTFSNWRRLGGWGHGSMILAFLLAVVAWGASSVFTPPKPKVIEPTNAIALADSYPPSRLKTILVPRSEWRPFAVITNRSAWLNLPEAARETLVRHGEQALAQALPLLPASLYPEYARSGNRSRFESVYFERRRLLHWLVLAECVEAQGRFLDGIANTLWASLDGIEVGTVWRQRIEDERRRQGGLAMVGSIV